MLGLEGKASGDELSINCPVHDDRRPSCSVNLQSGLWHCWSCGAAGDLAKLVSIIKGVDRKAALRLVEPHTPEGMLAVLKRNITQFSHRKGRTKQLELPTYPSGPLDYLYGRGYSPEICERYGAGYVQQEQFVRDGRSYTIRDYVSLPIRDSAGTLHSYCYRNTANANPRYLYTPDVSLATLWFGAHLYPAGDLIVVTEGALDSMWVSQSGLSAWGLLGANMVSELKLAQLRRHSQVVLFMDRDMPGVRATRVLGEKISQWVPTRVVRYPGKAMSRKDPTQPAKDPDDLSPELIHRCVERAIPYQAWAHSVA